MLINQINKHSLVFLSHLIRSSSSSILNIQPEMLEPEAPFGKECS